jgi:Uma2 family endonuclease
MSAEFLTAEQFAERLPELPDGGRWVELDAGRVSVLDQSDAAHGTFVLNLSKLLAEYLAERRSDPVGYACFELGLIVARNPDTIRRPAVSFFASDGLFAETDNAVTESVPVLVVETATTNRVRRAMRERVADYHHHGVSTVWVADPVERTVHVVSRGSVSRTVSAGDRLSGEALLPGLSLPVAELFAEPDWWSGRRGR